MKKPAAKPVAAKKPVAKTAAARKPVAAAESTTIRDNAPRRTAAQGWAVKGPAAKGAAAKAAPAKASPTKAAPAKKSPARKSPAKATPAKGAGAGRTVKGTPVASPPQPKPRKGGKKPVVPTDIVERLRLEVRRALEELKAKDIVELDVRGRTSIADFIVVASGTSTRHVKSVSDEVVRYSKQAGMMPLGVEGQREAEWVLVDLGDIIVHIMLPRVREFYGLERLWSVGGEEQSEAAYA